MHNLNESAGGFAGLATLIWLAPLAVVTRGRSPRVVYLAGIVVFGAMAAFRLPPVDNLLRCLPVLDVTDNRRLTLWVAFGLTMLGGIGLDQLGQTRRLLRPLDCTLDRGRAPVRGRWRFAIRQFRAGTSRAGHRSLSPCRVVDQRSRSDRLPTTGRATGSADLDFLPRYDALIAIELGVLAALAAWLRRSQCGAFPDSNR